MKATLSISTTFPIFTCKQPECLRKFTIGLILTEEEDTIQENLYVMIPGLREGQGYFHCPYCGTKTVAEERHE